ncbi:hypothetical protein MMC07_007802 [Pseudocyphellaria aurata]|nr:hypothetical protein [Pseudocyphellaria aurata]
MYHTASPRPQTRLSNTLATLLLSLPNPLFLPFLHAFYTTLVGLYSQLPSLRLDKYLYLLRRYIAAAFTYLARQGPQTDLAQGYLALMRGDIGPLSPGRGSEQAKVPDGLRYHVLDVWAEELARVALDNDLTDRDESTEQSAKQGELMMTPISALARDAKSKVVRARARECVRDWEIRRNGSSGAADEAEVVDQEENGGEVEEGDEWNGFED